MVIRRSGYQVVDIRITGYQAKKTLFFIFLISRYTGFLLPDFLVT